ncbi:uncharacterized protein Pyn_34610 [Prunus yedoensis var. nudiflora]|uniref:Cystatin domain-containing protein n=1 Tax=Prunus yedoensis var. nudiflora TaxID=2094558 RepID=A0A315AB71_PRUYE|nr:uncharacterized protein Pyn_34610 [Prunus yedoensis var. nudiflora]
MIPITNSVYLTYTSLYNPPLEMLLLLILFVTAASATEYQVHPPWELLDPNDPNVINAAKFAVLEYKKNITSSSNKLLFKKVNWCEYAYLASAFYGLEIAAKNESLPSPP